MRTEVVSSWEEEEEGSPHLETELLASDASGVGGVERGISIRDPSFRFRTRLVSGAGKSGGGQARIRRGSVAVVFLRMIDFSLSKKKKKSV